MIRRIWAIGLNTYREAIRQKVLFVLVFFAAVLILFSLLLGQLSLHADTKVVKDMGLASMMIFGSLLAIFIGIGLVFKEVERRTIYTILSKPVARFEFILGKFVGLAITVGLIIAGMTVLWLALLSLYSGPMDFNLLKAVVMIYCELTILISAALVFSSYSSSFMSAIFALSFLVMGHVTDDFAQLMTGKIYAMFESSAFLDQLSAYMLLGLVKIMGLFNLDHFAINAEVVHGVPISWQWIANGIFYAFCWNVLLLSVAVWLFRRKDLL